MTKGTDPVTGFEVTQNSSCYEDAYTHDGLTKREHFAAMAMNGLLFDPALGETGWTIQKFAKLSTEYADALITALNQEKQP